jgi:hypothetical protein
MTTTGSDDIKRISITEFRSEGYLQELNRRFLHPLGLAIEVEIADDGTERLGGVWDYRDDPEGISFDGLDLAPHAEHITALWNERRAARRSALGYMVQPAGTNDDLHILERDDDRWTLQHPLDCRPDLIACPVHQTVEDDADDGAHPETPGRYVVEFDDEGLAVYTPAVEVTP